jgi:ParB family chromosome partitioning protein
MAETNATLPNPAAKARPRALGRGLESLLPATPPAKPAAAPAPPPVVIEVNAEQAPTRWVPISLIDANPFQTRRATDPAKLQELKDSIAAEGLLQPILIRPIANGRFHVMAGERRLTAVRELGHEKVQANIVAATDDGALLKTIVENLQREDLNPMEQAHAFGRLAGEFGYTQDVIAAKTGKSRSAVTNYLRLLKLPEELQLAVAEDRLSMGHAKALLGLHDSPDAMSALGFRVLAQELSVRKTEEAVNWILHGKPKKEEKAAPPVDPNVREAQEQLQRALGLRVTIEDRNGKGKVTIEYADLDDFEVLMNSFGQRK